MIFRFGKDQSEKSRHSESKTSIRFRITLEYPESKYKRLTLYLDTGSALFLMSLIKIRHATSGMTVREKLKKVVIPRDDV
ncbi:MAG: hypothetical protein CVU05_10570 [Bacteroidetes bacterium HGW-Bacteroidetes-21]|jgi:hypothetical protein|nr:MAG: hypothetical protein CVU05_10570 [Bacteroidetes bacterium HGW-Bacteroidetes-21]